MCVGAHARACVCVCVSYHEVSQLRVYKAHLKRLHTRLHVGVLRLREDSLLNLSPSQGDMSFHEPEGYLSLCDSSFTETFFIDSVENHGDPFESDYYAQLIKM